MDIKWKDGNGNILNADSDRIIYYEKETDNQIKITKDEVKKITIEDGLMNIFRDFKSDLALTIIIPKKNNKGAIKIFNNYDKTGKSLKGKSNNFLLNLVLESSVSNPIFGLSGVAFVLSVLIIFIRVRFGQIALDIMQILIIIYIIYSIALYILTKIKRKNLKES